MTGNHDGNVIARARAGNGPHCFGIADGRGDFLIRARAAERNPLQLFPDAQLKRGRLQIEGKIEAWALSLELFEHLIQP